MRAGMNACMHECMNADVDVSWQDEGRYECIMSRYECINADNASKQMSMHLRADVNAAMQTSMHTQTHRGRHTEISMHQCKYLCIMTHRGSRWGQISMHHVTQWPYQWVMSHNSHVNKSCVCTHTHTPHTSRLFLHKRDPSEFASQCRDMCVSRDKTVSLQ